MSLKKRQIKLLIALIASLITLLGGFSAHNEQSTRDILGISSPGTYHVTQVADGDTIVVDMNSKEERIRLIGVDTPETQDPRKPVQCFGYAASEFTKQLIGTSTVRLEADALSSNRDRYNRLLRYVYLLDGRLVNAEIIKQGYGFAYTSFPFTKLDEFRSYETEARDNKRGLWSSCPIETNQFNSNQTAPAVQ